MNTKQKIILAIALIILAIITRFMPHLWNFTALTAVALFAGNYLGPKYAIFVVFFSMLLSDLFIGFYDWRLMAFVYGSFALVGFIPSLIKGKGMTRVFGMSLIGSTLFFIVTNWAVWYFGVMYSPDFSGLLSSFVAGIPFYRNAILGDLWYTGVFFGVYEFALYLNRQYVLKKKASTVLVDALDS